MAGVTDPALRLVCKELGAGLVVTELTSIHAVHAKQEDIKKFIEFSDKERPISIQLFGSNLEMLKKAVKIVEPHFDIIDYNMGCPAPHITDTIAGAALLQEPELTRKILRTLVKNSKRPITLKMRAGVNKPNQFLKIAKIAEEEGVSMVTLHARTLKQGYSEKADWSLIKKLKESVKIPVCGNGDIKTPEDAKRMLKETGCDYVMIGREAAKNPFIFTQINEYLKTGKYKTITDKKRLKYLFKYLKYTKKYNIKAANIRMQAMNFSKGCKGSKKLRGDLLGVNNPDNIKAIMKDFYDNL
jgi:nifR3 family TIM-barrel protein